MRPTLPSLLLCLLLLTGSAQGAFLLDGEPVDLGESYVLDGTTYVSPRSAARALLPGGDLSSLPRSTVPLRPLCASLGFYVSWDPATGDVFLASPAAARGLEGEDLTWLARIISAEAQGECWEGKIAVGSVVLNRVAHRDFPDTIYDVIFDDRWGGQFEPVRNGAVYWDPTPESVLAAGACLRGARVAGDSLYFLAPQLTDNHWTMENREYVTTIGVHWFYR